MKNKLFGISLITTLLAVTIFAQSVTDNRAENARQMVAKIGTGPKAKVDVKLRDSTKLNGFIASADDDSFSLVEGKSGVLREILFSDVDRIKKRVGLSSGSLIGIVVGAVGAAVIIGIVATRCRNEPGSC